MSTTTTNFLIKGQLISIRVTSLQEELNPLPQRRIKLTSEVNSFNFFCGSKNLFLYFVWPWRDTALKMTIYWKKNFGLDLGGMMWIVIPKEHTLILFKRRWSKNEQKILKFNTPAPNLFSASRNCTYFDGFSH